MRAHKSISQSVESSGEVVCGNTKNSRALIHRRIITEFTRAVLSVSSAQKKKRKEKNDKNERLIASVRTNGFSITNSDNRNAR